MNLSKKQIYIFIAIFILAIIIGLVGFFNSENKKINKNKSPDFVLNSVTTVKPGDWHEHKISPTHLIFTPEPTEKAIEGEYYAYGEHISISSNKYNQSPEKWIETVHDLDDVLVNEYKWEEDDGLKHLQVNHEPAGADGIQTTYYIFSEPRVYTLSYYKPNNLPEKSSGPVLFRKLVNEQRLLLNDNWMHEAHSYTRKEDNIYFINRDNKEFLIEEANPHTFEILWKPIYEGCRKGIYSRDATDVFWKDQLVEEADAESFEALINEYGKDKNNVYLRGEVQNDLDPDTFQPECNYG